MQDSTGIREGGMIDMATDEPEEIEFDDILECVEVVQDNNMDEPPWEHLCTLEHRIVTSNKRDGGVGQVGCESYIELLGDYSVEYDAVRALGASKQVAAERVAMIKKANLLAMEDWHTNGWDWWGVECSFFVGSREYHDSLYGVDDLEYASGECSVDAAMEVAEQLERDGYVVTGKPEEGKLLTARVPVAFSHLGRVENLVFSRSHTAEEWRSVIARNMSSQNFEEASN